MVGDMKAAAKDFEVVAGIVDTDQTTPRYFDLFIVLSEENNIRLLQRPSSGEYLIMNTFTGIERFILWNAQQVDIDLIEYGFEKDVKLLGKRLKKLAIETDPDFLRLLSDLHARQAPGILTLERILNDLITT